MTSSSYARITRVVDDNGVSNLYLEQGIVSAQASFTSKTLDEMASISMDFPKEFATSNYVVTSSLVIIGGYGGAGGIPHYLTRTSTGVTVYIDGHSTTLVKYNGEKKLVCRVSVMAYGQLSPTDADYQKYK